MSGNDDFASLSSDPASKRDDEVAELNSSLQSEKDGRAEDRFHSAVAITVLVDSHIFQALSGWGIASITFLSLVGLGMYAHRCQVDYAVKSIDAALAWFKKRIPYLSD